MAEKNQDPIRDKMPGGKRPGQNDNDKKNRFNSFLFPVLIGMAILSVILVNNGKKTIPIDWRTLKNDLLLKNEIDKIVIVNQKFAEIYIKDEKLDNPKHQRVLNRGLNQFARSGPHYQYNFPSVEYFLDQLNAAQQGLPEDEKIYPQSEERKDIFGDILTWIFPFLILIVIWLIIFRRMSGAGGGV